MPRRFICLCETLGRGSETGNRIFAGGLRQAGGNFGVAMRGYRSGSLCGCAWKRVICPASIWLKALNIMQRCWALPVVILLEHDGADDAQDAGLVREYAHHIGTAFHLLVQVLQRVGTVKLGSVPGRKGHVGQHHDLTLIHQCRKLRPALIGADRRDAARCPQHLSDRAD